MKKKVTKQPPKKKEVPVVFTLINVIDHFNGEWKGWYNKETGRLVTQGKHLDEYELFSNLGIRIEYMDIETEEEWKAIGEELPIKIETLKKRLEKVEK